MRATGLRSGAQQFVMPDGVSVKVHYVGDQEYIRIEGGQLSIAMDAGLIDLKSIAPASPLQYASGTRQDTSSTRAYNTPFTLAATAGKWSAWRSNPAQAPFYQIAGTVLFPPFAGYLRNGDQAPSFRAKRKAATPATEPPTWVDDPEDTALLAKKSMALGCPASVFTGRTRLYVQALYGRPLHHYGGDTSLVAATPRLSPSLAGTSPPSLSLPAFKHPDDETTYPALTIDTGTGVHFDAVTGKHWLLMIGADCINVYPLRSSTTGEAARKYLAGKKVNKTDTLGADDKEKLEAFILAYSLPDVKNVISVDCPGASSAYSMGYGWHWNWSGTAADVVTSTTVDQGLIDGIRNACMESTHRRVSLLRTVTPAEAWTATHTIVEGPKQWAVSRTYWCLAEPEWGSKQQVKTTPRNSSLFDCDAPFYAFYKRDALQVCRVAVQAVAATAAERISSYGFSSTPYGEQPEMYTIGYLGGSCEDVASANAHHKATFRIGQTVAGDLVVGKSSTSAYWSVTDKAEHRESVRTPSSDYFTNEPPAAYTYEWGYPGPYSEGGYYIATIGLPSWASIDAPAQIEFKETFDNRVTSESSTATIIVPFYDAEAVFMEATRFDTIDRSNRTESVKYSEAFSRTFRVLGFPFGSSNAKLPRFTVGGTGGILLSESTPAPSTDVEVTPVCKLMVGIVGAVEATMTDLDSYHDNSLEVANSSYLAWSGVGYVTPVAFAPGHINAVGVVGTPPLFPALVGWV